MALSQHAPGVYFDLDEDAYHADVALGSGDIRRLAVDWSNFWWESRFNPLREEDEPESEPLIVGKAFHIAVLEGPNAFQRLYGPTVLNGTTKEGKAERRDIVDSGRIPIKARHYKRALAAAGMIRCNRYLSAAFDGTIARELSVFWDDDGIPKKARLDTLKPRAIVDLKSIVNRDDRAFVDHCRRHIAEYRLHVQARHYLDARDRIRGFVLADQIFGVELERLDAVKERLLAATDHPAAFVLIFVQKAAAPLTWGTTFSPGNPMLEYGRQVILSAEENWRECIKTFGLDRAWIEERPLEEADESDFPPWLFR
jgi:PDDEXK-like domain of unknown function (DUF3799)